MLSVMYSCQSTQYTQDDSRRMQHAKELLSNQYLSSDIADFNGDEEFTDYLKSYIISENSKIDSKKMTEALVKASHQNHYDPVFLLAIIKTESRFNPIAIGTSGEVGLMQIKPSTAKWICKKSGFAWKGSAALKDPVYNLQVGSLYFKYLKKSLKSKSAHYINAYNMGINNLYRLPASSRISHPYYSRVMHNYIYIYQELQKIKKIQKT
jgi:soluble lytic murein transglycosylase